MLMVGSGWCRENQMVFSDTDFAKNESKPKANGKQKKPNGFVWFSFGF
jgi:hypothetical protein